MQHFPSRGSVRTVGVLVLLTAVLTAGAPSVITIRPGDTLSDLARKHHTTVAALKKANSLKGDMIYAGELLRLPGNAGPARPQQQGTSTRTVEQVYVVRPGDNLTRLAKRFHHSVPWLKARNRLQSSTIVIGQRLVYGTTVTRTGTATSTRSYGSVERSAAHHRAILSQRRHPSKATVRAMVRSAARRHGVPSSLALALAYQESGFQQRVVSPVDAIGVMQVLPSTGRGMSRIHGRSFDLLKTSDNVEAGVMLLRDLLRATGSTDKALAGYYQGLGSMSRVGLLPQTRQYIKNVKLLQRRFA
jgi:LysM repeat protein